MPGRGEQSYTPPLRQGFHTAHKHNVTDHKKYHNDKYNSKNVKLL